MQTIIIHDIPFTIPDEIEVDSAMQVMLEHAALEHLHSPMAVTRSNSGKHNVTFAAMDEVDTGLPELKISIGGTEATIYARNMSSEEITDKDISIARRLWTDGAFVNPPRTDGRCFIEF